MTAHDEGCSDSFTADWLAGCDGRVRAAILAASERREMPDGATIVPAFAADAGLFGVVRGHVALKLQSPPPRLVDLRRAGFWCGRTTRVPATPMRIGVTAHGPVELLALAAADVGQLLDVEPAVRAVFADLAARHADVLVQQLDVAMTPNPVARVARRLLVSLRVSGSEVLPLTQSELAELTFLSRSTVHRALGELEARGAVRAGYGHLVIADTGALLAAAGWRGPVDIAAPADFGAEAEPSAVGVSRASA